MTILTIWLEGILDFMLHGIKESEFYETSIIIKVCGKDGKGFQDLQAEPVRGLWRQSQHIILKGYNTVVSV